MLQRFKIPFNNPKIDKATEVLLSNSLKSNEYEGGDSSKKVVEALW